MRTYKDLAIAEEKQKLVDAVNKTNNLLVEAPTGSGKSLYIPWFLSNHFSGRIVVLQPRRIAALALAQYSAKLHNEPCGKTVGYQFRQDSCKSNATRILFQTYGNFLQELLHGKMNAEWVIFDEYHERKADMDLLFAYLLKLQATNRTSNSESIKAPRIAVMSAKLNREEMEQALGVKCLELGHPLYPVQILHQKPAAGTNISAGQGIESEVVRALRTLYRNNVWQTTLVFLPGKAEIAKCHTAASEALGDNVAEFLELYGGQDRETQDRIFEETERPRVIFTTNIAETSITVPNVTGVVDSGIERVSEYDDSEKVNVLRTLPISLQNAIQRSGRSGRTQNGCAIRLWTEDAEKHMPQGIVPEVLQIEPSEFLLQKAALEDSWAQSPNGSKVTIDDDVIASPKGAKQSQIKLPTAIPEAREKVATAMLEKFGMLQDGRITELGNRAIQTPISNIPLALILAKATCAADLPDLLLAAMAWIHSGTEFVQKSKNTLNLLTLASDTLSKAINVPREVSFTLKQLRDFRDTLKETSARPAPKKSEALSSHFIVQQLLAAFPDALATPSGNVYKLSNGNTIRLQVSEPPYALLALSMLRTGGGSKSELRVSLYAPVPKELLGGESDIIRYELLWRSGQERFIGVEIHESESPNGDVRETSRKEILPQEASPKILEKLKELTAEAWRDKLEKENWSGRYLTENLQTLLIKMRLAAKLYPEYGLPEFNEEDMELIFNELTDGIFLLRDINEDRYRNIVEDYFGKSMLAWLQKTFPDHYVLPNGKRARYSYQAVATADEQSSGKIVQSADGVLVEISARIEDFMQLRGEHKIADGKLKVRYDILAPNFRTIQKTWDLTSFWQNTYAEVRKELRGRYPKHPWPESVM
ncbi:ATP-dependent helicase C-terminal domain-containing protein [Fibrobacter succinogenes]|uniref:HrpA-like RNA helicase n=1 Tax=Fibrobacter succinogenes TaxID=833 RepID=A0A380RWE9_FIBSU|nr:ATP-dependent helicase C-terminal domain-containing protein [Fibrobacter succinogenes]PWJ37394.1 HrpA-like RNA helicase [Fibrobacter succinogenes subsp. elongatus]SUQ19641.1 HrpA-like RNA helicase [Fibrobacter succinogenes]